MIFPEFFIPTLKTDIGAEDSARLAELASKANLDDIDLVAMTEQLSEADAVEAFTLATNATEEQARELVRQYKSPPNPRQFQERDGDEVARY